VKVYVPSLSTKKVERFDCFTSWQAPPEAQKGGCMGWLLEDSAVLPEWAPPLRAPPPGDRWEWFPLAPIQLRLQAPPAL